MLRTLQPYFVNIKKRIVKTPKLYFRDSGVLHALLSITSFKQLYANPMYGYSWETTVVENIISKFHDWNSYYYRTAKGDELDLVISKADQIVAIEIKSSATPKVGKGFWRSLNDIKATRAYIIAPVRMPFKLNNDVRVMSLTDFLESFS